MNSTNVYIKTGENNFVCYTSGRTIYYETYAKGMWRGCYWSPDGRLKLPSHGWKSDAFHIVINREVINSGWEVVSIGEVQKTERGSRHIVVALTNPDKHLDLKVHTLLDGTPVIIRWLEITNKSNKPASLGACFPWSGRLWLGHNFTLGYYTRDIHCYEGWFDWKSIPVGDTVVKCQKGQGHDDPFFIVRNDDAGEYFICHLAWTANWEMNFKHDDAGLLWRFGPTAWPLQRVIAPNETIITPSVHLGHVAGDLDFAVQAMHNHIRKSVKLQENAEKSFLVQFLIPADGGFYCPFDEASIIKTIDVAASIESELFILDAYWWDVTCDWYPSKTRFPRGLKPVIDYVRSKGMLFGLYVEPEGGRGPIKESKVYKEHPEWFGPIDIINLTIPEAAAWVESELCRLIEENHLDLLRIDYNPFFTHEGPTTFRDGIEENNYWRYYEACYTMYERIHRKYPDLILQQAAAGGARNDLGFASRWHESYLTDGLYLPHELQVYCGLTMGLPPEIFVILHAAVGDEGIGAPQNFDTVLRFSFTSSTPQIFSGYVAPDIESLMPERKERFIRYANLYKKFIRPLLPTCKMYHHAPISSHTGVESGGWYALEYAAPDRSKGWALIARLNENGEHSYVFKPRGLDVGKTYLITFDSLDMSAVVDGLRLIQDGIPVRLESVASSELLLFETVK